MTIYGDGALFNMIKSMFNKTCDQEGVEKECECSKCFVK